MRYFKFYDSILRSVTLTPTDKMILSIIIHYWKGRDLKTYPKYITKGKEKLSLELGIDRHTIKRGLDNLIRAGLISILNYEDIISKNRTLPQIVVNEANVNVYFQDNIFEVMETHNHPNNPKPKTQTTVLNINYINNINKRVKENGN